MKLIKLFPDGHDLHLYLTQGCRTTDYTMPPELGMELNARYGYYRRRLVTQQWILPNACDRQTFLEEAIQQADWYAKAAAYVFRNYEWDLFMLKWHGPDILHHHSFHLIDPIHPLHDPAKAEEGWRLFADVYGAGDRMVGEIADAAGEDTVVAVVSDHGGFANVFASHGVTRRLFERAGWIAKNKDGTVNWSQTRVFPTSGGVMVNLKGRDPDGCVEPADYEQVRDAVIEFMQDMKHPVTKQHLFSLVCRKEDAAFMGYGGDQAGDIFFCTKPLGVERKYSMAEYAELASSRHMQGTVTGSHGPYLPSTRFSEGSLEGIFVAKGPGVRQGVWRDRPISLADVAPTLCRLLGIPAPAQSEGKVLGDLML